MRSKFQNVEFVLTNLFNKFIYCSKFASPRIASYSFSLTTYSTDPNRYLILSKNLLTPTLNREPTPLACLLQAPEDRIARPGLTTSRSAMLPRLCPGYHCCSMIHENSPKKERHPMKVRSKLLKPAVLLVAFLFFYRKTIRRGGEIRILKAVILPAEYV